MSPTAPTAARMPASRVARLYLPLAASWLLMAVELPLLTAVVARLADPKIHLAAFGAVVFPVSLVVEGPIIMLLAASTALCTDGPSYRRVRRFMHGAGALLTAAHVTIAFTPLFGVVASQLLEAPPEILEPARTGLQIMTPWTWSIAYRRFHQGVLIRHEHSREVSLGTVVRLLADVSVLALLALGTDLPGIVVGTAAVATGVLAEAAFIGWRVRPVLARRVMTAEPRGDPLGLGDFLRFYVPLALTPLIALAVQPLGAAAMGRMPRALDSLAAWPAVHGLVFMTRSLGLAFNEVVVTLVGDPGGVAALRRFGTTLALLTMGVLVLMAATPLAGLWFAGVSGLAPELVVLSRAGVALSILMPGYAVLQSWFTGTLVRQRTTRPVTEAVVVYLLVAAALLTLGAALDPVSGMLWAVPSLVLAGLCQTGWLWWRSRGALQDLSRRDGDPGAVRGDAGGTPSSAATRTPGPAGAPRRRAAP